jgi:hypothetical protein
MNRLHTAAPLALVFASLLQGCPWQNCSNLGESSTTVSFTQEDLDALLGAGTDTDPSDTDPSVVPPVDPATLTCEDVCALSFYEVTACELHATADEGTAITADCTYQEQCIGGRLHEVITTTQRASGPDAAATWLAQMAHDEAASVVAFRALAAELTAHGAPAYLLDRVRAAAADEVRHARQAHALAVARGGVVPRVEHQAPVARDLFSLALENVREAIVVETWAALRSRYQAEHAVDADLRAALVQIADDETRHAELARDLDAWLRDQLSPVDNARLDRARASAVDALIAQHRRPQATALRDLGLPDGDVATALLEGLRAVVWS